MDTDGSLQVEWKEWRDYHFLNPHSHNITDILKFWKHSMVRYTNFSVVLYCFSCQAPIKSRARIMIDGAESQVTNGCHKYQKRILPFNKPAS